MKSVKLKKILPVAVCLMALISMTSCNRGVGCPSDFSVNKAVTKTVVEVVKKAPTIAKEILK
ncbi:MAG: hypothetical protein AAF573_02405 [Bacteroidota bacterium]